MNCPHCTKEISYTCTRCTHSWTPRRTQSPKVCPECKSPYWNKKRRIEIK